MIYPPYEQFGEQSGVEPRWRHIEYLLLGCKPVVPACAPGLPVNLLRGDLRWASGDGPVMWSAVLGAFPSGNLDTECMSAPTVPFLLDPVRRCVGLGPFVAVCCMIVHALFRRMFLVGPVGCAGKRRVLWRSPRSRPC